VFARYTLLANTLELNCVFLLFISWDISVSKVISADWMTWVRFLTRAKNILFTASSCVARQAFCLVANGSFFPSGKMRPSVALTAYPYLGLNSHFTLHPVTFMALCLDTGTTLHFFIVIIIIIVLVVFVAAASVIRSQMFFSSRK
jgi:hypothetical protein